MAMPAALARLVGARALGVRGNPVKVVAGFGNGFISFWLLQKAPLLGLGKVLATPVAYLVTGHKLLEDVAVSDATILGIITNVMVTKSSPAPMQLGIERAKATIMSAIVRAGGGK